MSSINSRLKNFGFGKRKSTASIQTVDGVAPSSSSTPPPGQIPQPQQQQQQQQPNPPGGLAPLTLSTSTTSLPMNHPGAGNRPPSYTANFPPGPPGPPGGQQPLGRTSPLTGPGPNRTPPSQMVGGPPPIHTGAPVGYPPNMAPGMGGGPPMGHPGGPGGPPQGYPPAGYPPGPPPQPSGPMGQQQFGQNRAEVEGSSQSKAQLIVGIDFVSLLPPRFPRLLLDSSIANVANRVQPFLVSHSPLPPTTKLRKTLLPSGQVLAHTLSKRLVNLILPVWAPRTPADRYPDPHRSLLRPVSKGCWLGS